MVIVTFSLLKKNNWRSCISTALLLLQLCTRTPARYYNEIYNIYVFIINLEIL